MKTLVSKDGTKIAYEQTGNGKPLVIVGGALATHDFYTPLAQSLANDFTVYTYDRRGRGESVDTKPYAIEREIEDIQALIDVIGEEIFLYGHSAGAALSLHTIDALKSVTKAVISDIPFTPHSDGDAEAVKQFMAESSDINKLIADGNTVGAAKYFLKGFGLSETDVDEVLASPAGDSMKSAARALPYDYSVLVDGLVPTQLASSIRTPVCILADESTFQAADQLAHALKNGALTKIEAPTHQLSPTMVATNVKSFLK